MRSDRQFHIILAASLAIATVFLQLFSTFGLHVTSRGLSPAVYGALISMNGVIIVMLELPLTTITRRLPPRSVVAAGYLLIGIAFAAIAHADTVPTLIIVMVVFTFGEMISMPVSAAYIADNVPPTMRGRYMGVYGLMWALGLVLGPGIGVKLFASAPAVLWAACGLLAVAAAVLMLNARPRVPACEPLNSQEDTPPKSEIDLAQQQ
jgi:MFS family permease